MKMNKLLVWIDTFFIFAILAKTSSQTSSSYWRQDDTAMILGLESVLSVDSQNLEDCLIYCKGAKECRSITFEEHNKTCNGYSSRDANTAITVSSSEKYFYEISGMSNCSGTGYIYQNTHNLCYRVHLEGKARYKAIESCQSEGAELLIVDTMPKFDFIKTVVQNVKGQVSGLYVLIGGYFMTSEQKWIWRDGTDISMSKYYWLPDEPNNPLSEHCLTVYKDSGQWNDFLCHELIPYICQKNLS